MQGLFCVTYGFNSHFPVSFGSVGSATGFALIGGGGFEVGLARHLAIRRIEADYLPTRLPNEVNGAQNNLRLSAGASLRIR